MTVKNLSVAQVIIVTTTIGRGIQGDPLRPFVQVFDMDGRKIAVGDYTNPHTHDETI